MKTRYGVYDDGRGLKQECFLKFPWKKHGTGNVVVRGSLLLTIRNMYTLCFADDQIVLAYDNNDVCSMKEKPIEEYKNDVSK